LGQAYEVSGEGKERGPQGRIGIQVALPLELTLGPFKVLKHGTNDGIHENPWHIVAHAFYPEGLSARDQLRAPLPMSNRYEGVSRAMDNQGRDVESRQVLVAGTGGVGGSAMLF
jgi:hypothetical protein